MWDDADSLQSDVWPWSDRTRWFKVNVHGPVISTGLLVSNMSEVNENTTSTNNQLLISVLKRYNTFTHTVNLLQMIQNKACCKWYNTLQPVYGVNAKNWPCIVCVCVWLLASSSDWKGLVGHTTDYETPDYMHYTGYRQKDREGEVCILTCEQPKNPIFQPTWAVWLCDASFGRL